jgi:hypothetical protein
MKTKILKTIRAILMIIVVLHGLALALLLMISRQDLIVIAPYHYPPLITRDITEVKAAQIKFDAEKIAFETEKVKSKEEDVMCSTYIAFENTEWDLSTAQRHLGCNMFINILIMGILFGILLIPVCIMLEKKE